MYNWVSEMKLIFAFLVVYIPFYEPFTNSLVIPYMQPYADAWLYSLFMLVWDRLPIVFIGAVLVGGLLRSQLLEPRSQVEEFNIY